MESRRVVVDTNVLVSAILLPDSTSGRAVDFFIQRELLLASQETLEELREVLMRPKFDRYVTRAIRSAFWFLIQRRSNMVSILHHIQVCRDPKDDKFLSLAVNGEASLIVTGDLDLLVLDPFRNVKILTPAAYLEVS